MSLAATLHAGRPVYLLTVSEIRNPNLGLLLSAAGLDGFFLDMEHATYGWDDMASIVSVARGAGLHPIVRVPEVRRETMLKPLDAGASGLLIPMVEEAEQAEEAVAWAKYPPRGVRGVAIRRPHSGYGPVADAAAYMTEVNEAGSAVILQIESERAIDNLDALLSVPDVAGAYIGPFDLSVDMGCAGDLWNDRMVDAYVALIEAGKRHGVATGMQVGRAYDRAAEFVRMGMQIISLGSDVAYIVDQAAAARSAVEDAAARA